METSTSSSESPLLASSRTAAGFSAAAGDEEAAVSDSVICDDLLSLLKRFKAVMAGMAESHGLTSIQLYALHAIVQGNRTMGNVAHALHCDASNVTGIVDRLVAVGLLVRQESAQDRRVKTLVLTEKGRQLVARLTSEMPGQLGCSTLSATDRGTLHAVLQKLSAEA